LFSHSHSTVKIWWSVCQRNSFNVLSEILICIFVKFTFCNWWNVRFLFAVSFPQGPPSANVLHNGEGGLQFKCFVRDAQEGCQHYDLRLVAETDKMIYTGQNFGSDSQLTDFSKYFLLNKHTATHKKSNT
jgi:hypothetical protein